MQLDQHVIPDQLVVLDHQNGFMSAVQGRHERLGRGRAGAGRQVHLDRRAMAFLTVDLNMPGRLLDEAVDHAQSETGSLAGTLGGEKRIEHLVDYVGANADAGVAHRDQDVVSGADIIIVPGVILVEHDEAGLKDELAPIRHCVARVQCEIEQRSCKLGGIDGGDADVVLEYGFDLDLFAKRRTQQFGGIDDERVDVDLARLQRLLAGEGQQMLRQLGAARGGIVDHPGDRGELRLVGDGFGQNLDCSGDDGEDVVEVVGDAASELADRFHLLGMADSVFRRDPVGEITDEAVEHDAVAPLQLGDGKLDLDLLTVAPQGLDFQTLSEDPAFAGEQKMFEAGAVRGAVPLRHDQFDELLSDRVAARPAEDLFRPAVPVRDAAPLVHLHEGVQRRFDDAARKLFAFAQGLLRPQGFGHVAADEEEALHRLGPCPEPRQRHAVPVLMKDPRIRYLVALAAPGRAHVRARHFEIVGVDEVFAAAANHLVRPVAQDGFAAWADLDQKAARIHYEYQILRRLEDAAAFLGPLAQRELCPVDLGDIARDLGNADGRPGRRLDRR